MELIGLTLEVASAIAGDEWMYRRGSMGRRIAGLAMAASGLMVAGALTYGLAAEAWRLAGELGGAAIERVHGA